jgi:hypothetical protein
MSIYPGNLLTATAASVAGSPTPVRTWQWLRNGTAISGKTASTYRLTYDDIGASVAVRQIESNVAGQKTATSLPVTDITEFDPSSLFASGEAGDWFDPSDLSRMWQDTGGIGAEHLPVDADGQTVALMQGQRGSISGSNLVSNGGFDADTAGWVGGFQSEDSTFASVGGQAVLTVTAAGPTSARWVHAVSGLAVGGVYKLEIDIVGMTGAGDRVIVWTSLGDGTGGQTFFWAAGNKRTRFVVATATTMYITVGFANGVSGGTVTVDNVSLREATGVNLVQSDAAKRPAYKTSAGLHWLQFDGTNDFIGSLFSISQPITRVSGVRLGTATSGQLIGGGTLNTAALYYGSATQLAVFSGSVTGTQTVSAETKYIITEIHNGASSSLQLNNETAVTGDAGTSLPGGITLSAVAGGADNFTDPNFYGLIFIDRLLTMDELSATKGFIAAKTGVTLP